jgi:fatty-acyl-CoA synthase
MTQLSHVRGATTPPLRQETIGDALSAAAERWPDGEALVSVHQDIRWRWRELNAKAEALAAGFFSLGLRRGDRLGIWAPNCAEWTLTQFATAKAGIILVNINPAYRLSELEYTLNKVGVSALVTPERFKTSEYVAMVEELAPEIARSSGVVASARLPHLKHAIQIGGTPRKGWLGFDGIAARATAEDRRAIAGLKEGDRLCIPVPLYHCFGMVMGNLGCLTHGATMVYPADAFDPLAVLQTVEKERCTGLYGVPTMFIAELGHPDFAKFDLSSLRTGCMAGSPCPVEVMKRVISDMNMTDVTIAYGMTETSPVSFQTGEDDPLERRVSTIGRVQPHLECKAVDLDGKTVPAGTPGELCTRGYSVMIGYWDDPEKTAEAIDAEGWMHTGDLATIDAEGYGNIVGRLKDMVIRGGENVYPREIEEYLYRHPKVEDVAVVGVPDEKFGEEICAWVKLKPGESATEDEIKAFCKGQIAHYKVPRYVRFVGEFPMTVTGKVQKFQIRDAMIEELKLDIAKTA